MNEKLIINPISLDNQRPTEIKECFIELFDEHLRYVLNFMADEPIVEGDMDAGTKSVLNAFDVTAKKKFVSGVEKSYTNGKRWLVSIMIVGFGNDIKIYTRTETIAQQFYDRINNWLLK